MDTFALSIQEVKPVDFIEFKLDIPDGTTFPLKVNQCPLTQAQKEFYLPLLDEFEEAGILHPIWSDKVKAVHPTVLAQKAHGMSSLTMEEIRWIVEDQCKELGVEPDHTLLPWPMNSQDNKQTQRTAKLKWRVCQNFNEINRVTRVAPMLQGDIRAKRQWLAGHEYICVIDFASGFYAIKVNKQSQPYLCIYTEGHGFQCYQRMPMGTLGSPACFADLTMHAFKALVVPLKLETFVNDNGMAGNVFEELLEQLHMFFECCRERRLSISPSKLQLFMQEVVFGGSHIRKEGIKPDITKLEAVAKWPPPANLLEPMHFLGLTGH